MECGSWWSAALQQLHHALDPTLERLARELPTAPGVGVRGNVVLGCRRGRGWGAGHGPEELMDGRGVGWSHNAHGEPRQGWGCSVWWDGSAQARVAQHPPGKNCFAVLGVRDS